MHKLTTSLALASALVFASWALLGCAHNATQHCRAQDECARSAICYRGYCIADMPVDAAVPVDDASACPSGFTQCDRCVDLLTDRDNCGRCDSRCHGGDQDRCVLGECGP